MPSVTAPISNLGEGPFGSCDQVWVEKLNAHTSSNNWPPWTPPTTIIRSRAKSAIAAGEARTEGPLVASTRVHFRAAKEKIHTSRPAPKPPKSTASCRLRSKTIAWVQRGEGPRPWIWIQPFPAEDSVEPIAAHTLVDGIHNRAITTKIVWRTVRLCGQWVPVFLGACGDRFIRVLLR